MPEIESLSGDFDPFAPLGTAVSLWLLGADRRKPWPLVIEYQVAEVRFSMSLIKVRYSEQ